MLLFPGDLPMKINSFILFTNVLLKKINNRETYYRRLYYTHTHIHTHTHTHTHIYIYIYYIYIYIYIQVYVYMHIYMHICICLYIYICMCLYIYIYMCVCVYIYMYIYVCMYVFMYIDIHICVGGARGVTVIIVWNGYTNPRLLYFTYGYVNILERGMNPSVLPYTMSK